MKIECPKCSSGWITEQEQAEQHDRCIDCRAKAKTDAELEAKQKAFHRAQRFMK